MLRFVNICLVLGLVALAYVIYDVKYEARALDEDIAGLSKEIEAERDAVAVLRAEWSLLNRPERIERLAAKYLKLAPAQPRQLVTLDTVSESDFERARVEAADQTLAQAPAPTASPVADPAEAASAEPDSDEAASVQADPAKTVPARIVLAKTVPAKSVRAKANLAKYNLDRHVNLHKGDFSELDHTRYDLIFCDAMHDAHEIKHNLPLLLGVSQSICTLAFHDMTPAAIETVLASAPVKFITRADSLGVFQLGSERQ